MSISISSTFSNLHLRSFDYLTDSVSIAEILLHERTFAGGFLDSSRIPESLADALDLLDERHNGATMFSVVDVNELGNERVIGSTGLMSWDYDRETVKIGRTLVHPDHWGKGVNHELKIMLLDWLFSCDVGRVECDVAPANFNSIKSLEHFGFTFEGVRRRTTKRTDGSWRDTAIFSMVVEEWEAKRENVAERLSSRSISR